MRANKFLLTLALSCGLAALPALAQNSTTSSDQQTPSAQTSPDQQTPSAQPGTMPDQNSTAQQSPTAAGDSSMVQSNVQSALQKDDQLSGQNINVRVNSKNEIVLTGTVSSQAQKDHAEQVASQTASSGYTVKNRIKVSGSGSMGSTGSTSTPQK